MIDKSATKQTMTGGNLEHGDNNKLKKTENVKNPILDSNCEPGGEINSRDSKDIDENNITEHKCNDNGKDTYTQCYLYYVSIMHVIILLK